MLSDISENENNNFWNFSTESKLQPSRSEMRRLDNTNNYYNNNNYNSNVITIIFYNYRREDLYLAFCITCLIFTCGNKDQRLIITTKIIITT